MTPTQPSQAVEAAEREKLARQLLEAEYLAGGKEGPYPTYAQLAREAKGAFTLCSIRAIEKALDLARPHEVAAVGDARRDEVMRHDYPVLQQFHTKHAMGPLAAPSCLCCGKSTQGVEIGVQHLELPGIVICKPCKDAASRGDAKDAIAEAVQEFDHALTNWAAAYPITVFPEPDMAKVHALLQTEGMTLDAVSASNMRHVTNKLNELFEPVRAAILASKATAAGEGK